MGIRVQILTVKRAASSPKWAITPSNGSRESSAAALRLKLERQRGHRPADAGQKTRLTVSRRQSAHPILNSESFRELSSPRPLRCLPAEAPNCRLPRSLVA